MAIQDIINSPSTRYQGSKRKILPWLKSIFNNLEFDTVLDGFGGSGSVSFLLKSMEKEVTFNDILKSNYQTGIALIENSNTILTKEDIRFIFNNNKGKDNRRVISLLYKNYYFLEDENRLLDKVINNIEALSKLYRRKTLRYKKALAYHFLFQSCLVKRPFNLFHRKNLNLRTRDVKRSFGNKSTWDKTFEEHFKNFNDEHSKFICRNGKNNKAINIDIFDVDVDFDLVYLDPPYTRKHSSSPQNYADMYHFLEGIMNYDIWMDNFDKTKMHKPFICPNGLWNGDLIKNFNMLFRKFRNSIIVVSYGNKGKPSISTIVRLMKKYKISVITKSHPYSYRLNKNNGKGYREVLIIGT